MFKLYAIVFLVASLYVKENEGLSSILNLLNIQAQVNQGIENLINDAQKRSEEANNIASLFSDIFTNLDKEREENAAITLSQLQLSADTELTNAVINAGGAIDKIKDCRQEHETELNAFWAEASKNVTGCVTEKIEEAITVVKNIVGASIEIGKIAAGLRDRIETSCPLASSSIADKIVQGTCALAVIAKASTEVAGQGIVIAINVAAGYELYSSVSSIQGDLYKCLAERALAATIVYIPIVKPVVECTLN